VRRSPLAGVLATAATRVALNVRLAANLNPVEVHVPVNLETLLTTLRDHFAVGGCPRGQ